MINQHAINLQARGQKRRAVSNLLFLRNDCWALNKISAQPLVLPPCKCRPRCFHRGWHSVVSERNKDRLNASAFPIKARSCRTARAPLETCTRLDKIINAAYEAFSLHKFLRSLLVPYSEKFQAFLLYCPIQCPRQFY